MLTRSQRLGPVNGNTVPYTANVPAGKKLDGSALTDAIEIGQFLAITGMT
jgi:hypothetical protein